MFSAKSMILRLLLLRYSILLSLYDFWAIFGLLRSILSGLEKFPVDFVKFTKVLRSFRCLLVSSVIFCYSMPLPMLFGFAPFDDLGNFAEDFVVVPEVFGVFSEIDDFTVIPCSISDFTAFIRFLGNVRSCSGQFRKILQDPPMFLVSFSEFDSFGVILCSFCLF